jgi:endonuclease/exonuclease/phosphatase family metal-dependent hydrolase
MSNNYTGLRQFAREDKAAARRCAGRLIAMREALAPLRKRKRESAMLLATWNIRDFDSNKFGFGPRLPETFYYIAEIISCFDLVAVQEVTGGHAAKTPEALYRKWRTWQMSDHAPLWVEVETDFSADYLKQFAG